MKINMNTEAEFIKVIGKPIQDIMENEVSWQSLIYDLVKSEQLDPWDVDIVSLTNGLLERIRRMEEADLFISSKLLLVSSILVRMKSNILYNRLMSLDKKDTKVDKPEVYEYEEPPLLIPRTPLTRQKKVTLQELMKALNDAVKTEKRRIKKRGILKQQEEQIINNIPKVRINLKDKIAEVYRKIRQLFKREKIQRIMFNELVSSDNKEEKVLTFIPLLHLDYQEKINLVQQRTFGNIEIEMHHK